MAKQGWRWLGALSAHSQGLSLLRGAGSMAAAHLLLVEHVVLLPECQFWVPSPSLRHPLLPGLLSLLRALQWPHASLAAATMEKVGWVRQESISSHTLHASIQSSGYSVVLALNVTVHITHR